MRLTWLQRHLLGLTTLLVSGAAAAQAPSATPNPKPPVSGAVPSAKAADPAPGGASSEATAGSVSEADDEDEDDDDEDEPGDRLTQDRDAELDVLNTLPEPAEPKASEQPVVAPAPAFGRRRTVDFGPLFGVTWRTTDAPTSYDAGFTWGAFARVDVWRFLAARLSYLNSGHTVDGSPSVDGAPRGAYPTVTSYSFRATLEPTWAPSFAAEQLRLFGVLGVGWGKTRIEHIEDDDSAHHLTSVRAGVFLEYPLGLGASYDLLDGWLSVGALYTFALHSRATGPIHQEARGVTRGGERVTVAGLPEPTHSQTLALTLAVVF